MAVMRITPSDPGIHSSIPLDGVAVAKLHADGWVGRKGGQTPTL